MKAGASKLINDENWENRSGGGSNTYLHVGFSKIWREKIHIIIQKLHESNCIKWLLTRMYYHRLPNSVKLIQGYMESKLQKGLA